MKRTRRKNKYLVDTEDEDDEQKNAQEEIEKYENVKKIIKKHIEQIN